MDKNINETQEQCTIHSVSGSTGDKEKICKHEYRTFVDRVDKSRQVFCWKCGKDYEGSYSRRM